ncbi:hypothetical protein ELI41_31730 (plasmid) [Rhizobium leguminosarum]|nr:hypothetical protein ELI41_31730 [Rhizobium leguminosarum]TAY71684.1 hypothetical protein ELH83_32660 [Rhizobium leguminosarum]
MSREMSGRRALPPGQDDAADNRRRPLVSKVNGGVRPRRTASLIVPRVLAILDVQKGRISRQRGLTGLETNTVPDYLGLIGVAGECSTRAFATAEVAFLLLTTDVLALVLRAMSERSVRFRPGLFCCHKGGCPAMA